MRLLKLNSDYVIPLLTAGALPTTMNGSCLSVKPNAPTMAFNVLEIWLHFLSAVVSSYPSLPPTPFQTHWHPCSSSNVLDSFLLQGFALAVHSAWNALPSDIHMAPSLTSSNLRANLTSSLKATLMTIMPTHPAHPQHSQHPLSCSTFFIFSCSAYSL